VHKEKRQFMYQKHICHAGLANIQYKTFFHLCRMESISFDMEKKTGSTFVLCDSFQNEVLSIITVENDFEKIVKLMYSSLNFLLKHSNNSLKILKDEEIKSMDEFNINSNISKIKSILKLIKEHEEEEGNKAKE